MKKGLFVLLLSVVCGTSFTYAQKKESQKTWEESEARQVIPEVRTFVTPMIFDMQLLSKTRETYGPYYFPIKSIGDTYNYELTSFQNRALYRAVKESDADAIIEPIFDSYVLDSDSKTLVIELSGYPVKYTNFRPVTSSEINMIGVVYPLTNTTFSIGAGNTDQRNNKSAETKK